MFTLALSTGASTVRFSPALIVLLTSGKSFTFIVMRKGSLPGFHTTEVELFSPVGMVHQNLAMPSSCFQRCNTLKVFSNNLV